MSSAKTKKEQLVELMEEYVNGNIIDISKFRNENPNDYALLSHYFGSVNEAIEKNGWVKIQRRGKQGTVTLRNKLAYDMLKQMREHHTLEEIAQKYGVTRPGVNQLYKALESSIED